MSIMLLHQSYQEAVARDRIARSVPVAAPPVLRPRLAHVLRVVAAWVQPDPALADGVRAPSRGAVRPRGAGAGQPVRRGPGSHPRPPGRSVVQRRSDG